MDAGPIARVFTPDPETASNGILDLRTISAGFWAEAVVAALLFRRGKWKGMKVGGGETLYSSP